MNLTNKDRTKVEQDAYYNIRMRLGAGGQLTAADHRDLQTMLLFAILDELKKLNDRETAYI